MVIMELPVEQHIIVDLTEVSNPVIYANQNDDDSRIAYCHIQNNGVDFPCDGYYITIRIKKSNGNGLSKAIGYDGYGSINGNIISFPIIKEMTISPGRQIVDIEIFNKKDGELIYSTVFYLRVQKGAISNNEITDSDDYASYINLYKEEVKDRINADKIITDNLNNEVKRATNAEDDLDSKKVDKTTVATSSTLGLIKSGMDVTVDESGNVSVNDNSHNHTVSNISDLTATATELNYTDGVTSNIQTQLDSKAPLANPTLTGTPKAPTASDGTNTTQIATTAFVQTAVSNHNTSTTAHSDIRDLITELTARLNALADSDDTTLDQLSEIVDYIKSNRSLIESVTTSKVNVSDIIDNLISTATNKPLSANQGRVLKGFIDSLESAFNIHTDDSDIHITASERINWDNAYTHSKSDHAPSDAQANQNAFSKVGVVDSNALLLSSNEEEGILNLIAGKNIHLSANQESNEIKISSTDSVDYANSAGSADKVQGTVIVGTTDPGVTGGIWIG